MTAVIDELLHVVQLEQIEDNIFRGESRDIGTPRVFGGQVLAQSLLAATRTVDSIRKPHSMHAYFLRAGDVSAPIVYEVDRSREGRSFTTRRVVAIQHGRPIFTMASSFQVPEEGMEHQMPAPDVPDPDSLGPTSPLSAEILAEIPVKLRRWFLQAGPFEFRSVQAFNPLNPGVHEPARQVWFRCRGKLPDDMDLHQVLLAYASDFQLVGTASLPHDVSFLSGKLMLASLDHAMWFHRPCRVDDWLLYACDSPSASGGRGLARGSIYNRDGVLVASTAQEGVMRKLQ
ncbi:MAG: acyl-CoA thioesterase II [Xanthomonadales bacterium]|nr:acyl-CoA thioesterase II [Xanthomonadales bacterium]